MQATTKQEANRIAFFGARKMDEQGYRYEQVGGSWLMTTPDGDKTYWVATKDAAGNALCDCAFFAENKTFGVCKHITRARQMEADQIAQAERMAEEDRIAQDAERWMSRSYGLAAMEDDNLTRNFG